MRDALADTSVTYEGVTGTFSFDDQNNPIKSASILQIQGGEEVFVENF